VKIKLLLWQQILLSMAAGVICGLILQDNAQYLKPLGDLFLNLIKMITIPLIFFSLTAAITSMENMRVVGEIGIKSLLLFFFTTALAVTIAIVIAEIFQPGAGVLIDLSDSIPGRRPQFSFVDTLINIIPTNPVSALAEGNVLQVIMFSIILGISINLSGEKGKKLASIVESASDVMFSMINIIMKFAPIGIFALIAWVVGTQDSELIISLGKFIAVAYFACILHATLSYGILISVLARLNPLKLYAKSLEVITFAYSTSSSSATLPITIKTAETKLGVSRQTATFVLPMGATINMDGTSMYQAIAAVFIAQITGIEFGMNEYLTIVLTASLVSIGSAGVPGASIILMSMVFNSVGLPLEGIAVIAGVDRIIDMARTSVNVLGDMTNALIIDKSENQLDVKKYLS